MPIFKVLLTVLLVLEFLSGFTHAQASADETQTLAPSSEEMGSFGWDQPNLDLIKFLPWALSRQGAPWEFENFQNRFLFHMIQARTRLLRDQLTALDSQGKTDWAAVSAESHVVHAAIDEALIDEAFQAILSSSYETLATSLQAALTRDLYEFRRLGLLANMVERNLFTNSQLIQLRKALQSFDNRIGILADPERERLIKQISIYLSCPAILTD